MGKFSNLTDEQLAELIQQAEAESEPAAPELPDLSGYNPGGDKLESLSFRMAQPARGVRQSATAGAPSVRPTAGRVKFAEPTVMEEFKPAFPGQEETGLGYAGRATRNAGRSLAELGITMAPFVVGGPAGALSLIPQAAEALAQGRPAEVARGLTYGPAADAATSIGEKGFTEAFAEDPLAIPKAVLPAFLIPRVRGAVASGVRALPGGRMIVGESPAQLQGAARLDAFDVPQAPIPRERVPQRLFARTEESAPRPSGPAALPPAQRFPLLPPPGPIEVPPGGFENLRSFLRTDPRRPEPEIAQPSGELPPEALALPPAEVPPPEAIGTVEAPATAKTAEVPRRNAQEMDSNEKLYREAVANGLATRVSKMLAKGKDPRDVAATIGAQRKSLAYGELLVKAVMEREKSNPAWEAKVDQMLPPKRASLNDSGQAPPFPKRPAKTGRQAEGQTEHEAYLSKMREINERAQALPDLF